MRQLAMRSWGIAAAVLGTIVPATTGRADPGSPPVQAGQTTWAPKLYGFCMDAADSRHRSIPEQARMLHELGFDGAGYELWLGDDLDKNLRTLDEADLKVYLFWIVVHLDPKIFVVTINGAKLGSKTWTNGLIQPLDQGDFDNRQLLSTLRAIGYRGPIGLMCYGIPGDAREYLERSMKVWKTWQAQ